MPVADQVSLGGAGIDLIGRGNVWVEDSILDGASQAVAQALIALALGGTTITKIGRASCRERV